VAQREEAAWLGPALEALKSTGGYGMRRRWVIEEINGHPAEASPLTEVMLAHGFERDYKGLSAGSAGLFQ